MTAPVNPVIEVSDGGNPIAAELFCQHLSRRLCLFFVTIVMIEMTSFPPKNRSASLLHNMPFEPCLALRGLGRHETTSNFAEFSSES